MTEPDQLVTEPLQADKSLGELVGAMTSDLSTLVRQEIALAKVELRAEAKQAGTAAGMFGVAGVGAWMAVVMLSFALAWLLDQAMNTALAFAIVGVLWAVVAGLLALRAKKKLASTKALPETMETLKEDVQWTKAQMK